MRLRVRVVECSFEDDGYALLCVFRGVDDAGDEHYVILQQINEQQDLKEDWGVHLEIDGQANGEYRKINECRFRRDALSLDLSDQLGALSGIVGVDLAVSISDDEHRALADGLRRIFRTDQALLAFQE